MAIMLLFSAEVAFNCYCRCCCLSGQGKQNMPPKRDNKRSVAAD